MYIIPCQLPQRIWSYHIYNVFGCNQYPCYTPRRGFLDVASQLPPRFASLLSSCLRLVSQMWSPCCFPDVVSELVQGFCGCCLLVFHLFPRCGLRIVFRLSSTIWICLPDLVVQFSPFFPFVSPLFPSCLSDLVSHIYVYV